MKHRPSSESITAHLEGEAVVLHLGSKRYFQLNDTGAAVWKGLEKGMDRDAIVESLVGQFEVDRESAGTAYDRLISELRAAGLVSPAASDPGL